jgi:hypothetical protein
MGRKLTTGAEGDANRVGDDVDALLDLHAGLHVEGELLGVCADLEGRAADADRAGGAGVGHLARESLVDRGGWMGREGLAAAPWKNFNRVASSAGSRTRASTGDERIDGTATRDGNHARFLRVDIVRR